MYKPAKPGGAHLLPLFRNRALGVSVHMGYKQVTGCFVAESPTSGIISGPSTKVADALSSNKVWLQQASKCFTAGEGRICEFGP